MATTFSSPATTTAFLISPFAVTSARFSSSPLLPHRFSNSSFSTSYKLSSECRRGHRFQVRASSEGASGSEIFTDLKEKWDSIENKTNVIIYGGGGIVAVWFSSVFVAAINSVPLLPKILELVGVGYTGWFVYRYILFKSSRKELVSDIETLKKKIAGTE